MPKRFPAVAVTVSVALCAGCAGMASGPPPTPVPTALPTPSPTVRVAFLVAVTPLPTQKVQRRTPQPRPTPFATPRAPYILLRPNSGPPASRTISISGGNFPRSSQIQLVWSPGGHVAGLSATTYANSKGTISSSFDVPGSPPGTYTVTARVAGDVYASAKYTVTSSATLAVTAIPVSKGERVAITGKHFLPNLKLLLAAYPVVRGAKPVVLGTSRTDHIGAFSVQVLTSKLGPGQYELAAWSLSQVSAQMASAFFQVDV